MSLIPLLFNYDPFEYRRPRRALDFDHFGLAITPDEIRALVDFPRLKISPRESLELIPSTIGKNGFQTCIDVQQFKPNEITVKTVDNTVIVEGKHGERQDEHGIISRHFVTRYTLPEGYDPKSVISTLSSDGVLTIKAPPPKQAIKSNERTVEIQQTDPAHLNMKENPSSEPKKEEPKKKKSLRLIII